MEAWDAICARRNVRQYTPEPVSEDDLDRIAEAGWRAPSAKNRQAWDLGLGYPADRPLKPIRKPNRRPFDEVVHHGRW
jgi:nitroreductase